MTSGVIVIYHGNCRDGFGAAYLLKQMIPSAELHAGAYGKAPPDVTGKLVFLVDFSYPYEVMEEMAAVAISMLIYDHHVGAQTDIEKFWKAHGVKEKFDNEHSGTGLILQKFFGDKPLDGRYIFEAIEDRDLWKFKLPDTKEITAALKSIPMTIEAWRDFIALPKETVITIGKALVANDDEAVKQYQKRAHTLNIAGYEVPAVNAPASIVSELTGLLAVGHDFAASYAFVEADVVVVSLRSTEDGADVSEIAKQFGGGGHKHASGFKVDRATFISFFG